MNLLSTMFSPNISHFSILPFNLIAGQGSLFPRCFLDWKFQSTKIYGKQVVWIWREWCFSWKTENIPLVWGGERLCVQNRGLWILIPGQSYECNDSRPRRHQRRAWNPLRVHSSKTLDCLFCTEAPELSPCPSPSRDSLELVEKTQS